MIHKTNRIVMSGKLNRVSDAIVVVFITSTILDFYIFDLVNIIPFELVTPFSLFIGIIIGYISVYVFDIRCVLADRISAVDPEP